VEKVVSVPHSDLDSLVQHIQFCLEMTQVEVGEHQTEESETCLLQLPWTKHFITIVKVMTKTFEFRDFSILNFLVMRLS